MTEDHAYEAAVQEAERVFAAELQLQRRLHAAHTATVIWGSGWTTETCHHGRKPSECDDCGFARDCERDDERGW